MYRRLTTCAKPNNSSPPRAAVPVVVKLERQNAVDNLDEILKETDVIMVARGDLGVECPLPLLPALQKRIIRACNAISKPVIVSHADVALHGQQPPRPPAPRPRTWPTPCWTAPTA